MENSTRRDVGRPSKIAQYQTQVAQWLREEPHLSSAEVLGRVRLAGYLGGKSALYKLVSRLRVRGCGYRRCPRCRALLRDIVEVCQHCGLSDPSAVPRPPSVEAGAFSDDTATTARRYPPSRAAGERYLVVAAADRGKLYEYFKRTLGRTAAIEVVPERRTIDRRKHAATVPADRRRADRRSRPALDDELRAFGFAIVTRD